MAEPATAAETLASVVPFPTSTNSWITVNIHRKDAPMTDTTAEGSSSRRGSDTERRAQYSPTDSLNVFVETHSGDVTVRASDSLEAHVTLRAASLAYAQALDTAEVDFDPTHNTLSIRTQPHGFSFSSKGLRRGKSTWLNFGSSDLDVLLEVPQGSAIEISTVSGDTSLSGSLGIVSVKSVSGDVVARDTSDSFEVQTASGDIHSGDVLTTLKCKSASGDVVCHGAAARTEIHSASGDILLSADQPGTIAVRNVSGDVTVRVARGLAVDISGDTLSGSMGSNIDLDGGGESVDGDVLVIKVSTVSGDIRIDKAS